MATLVALSCLGANPLAARGTLWSIGTADNSSREFGEPRKSVVYRAGESDPGRDWSAEHPGPDQTGRPPVFRIEFALQGRPSGIYYLGLHLLFRGPTAPLYEVAVNGASGRFTLEPEPARPLRGTDGNAIPFFGRQRLTVELPARLFKAGANEIALSVVEGGPVYYDAVALEQDDRLTASCDAQAKLRPTVFWERRGSALHETVNLVVPACLLEPAGRGTVKVSIGGQAFAEELRASAPFGELVVPLAVREPASRREAKVELHSSGGRREFSLELEPARKWKVFVCPSTHLDIGYTANQPRAVDVHVRNIEKAMELIERYPSFRWNVEGAWVAKKFLDRRAPEDRDKFLRLAKEGRIALEAFDFNLQTLVCSLEELNRSTENSFSFSNRHGIPVEVATVSDVPSLSWAIPSVLAHAGVRYLAAGANQARGPLLLYGGLDRESPFFWEGPDGKRVLVWLTRGYGQVRRLFGIPGSIEQGRDALSAFLAAFGRGYRYDAVLVYGQDGDNAPIGEGSAPFFDEWNSRYAYPQIIPAGLAEFFRYVEKQGTRDLKVHRGDGGAYWEDGVGQCPRAVAANRRNQAGIVDLEKLASLATLWDPRLNYPAEEIRGLWQRVLLFDEHTFGARASTLQRDAPQTREQWRLKESFALAAASELRWAQLEWLAQLNRWIPHAQDAVVVWNLNNWPRTDIVEAQLRAGQSLYDAQTGRAEPYEKVREQDEYKVVRFLARQVPALGYKVYSVGPEQQSSEGARGASDTLENRFYRVTLDAERAGVRSIYDKQLNRELVSQASPYGAGAYLYVAETSGPRGIRPGAGNNWYTGVRTRIDINDFELPAPKLEVRTARGGRVARRQDSAIGQAAVLEAEGEAGSRVELELRLYSEIKRIDLAARVWRKASEGRVAEAVYFAFPFAVESPRFTYELALGRVDPGKDMLPGGATEWFSVNNWVTVSTGGVSVALATPDAPLVTLGDINRGKWPEKFESPREASVFSYAMNNYWLTNFPGGQEEGEFAFRYSITSAASPDFAGLARFGEEARHPLLADHLPGRAAVERRLPESLLRVEGRSVNLVTMKKAIDGSGYVVRLAETGGQGGEAVIQGGALPVRRAFLCSTHERRTEELPVESGVVRVRLGGHGMETVLLEVPPGPAVR